MGAIYSPCKSSSSPSPSGLFIALECLFLQSHTLRARHCCPPLSHRRFRPNQLLIDDPSSFAYRRLSGPPYPCPTTTPWHPHHLTTPLISWFLPAHKQDTSTALRSSHGRFLIDGGITSKWHHLGRNSEVSSFFLQLPYVRTFHLTHAHRSFFPLLSLNGVGFVHAKLLTIFSAAQTLCDLVRSLHPQVCLTS